MKATVNRVTGYEDAIIAMYLSKRTWTPDLDDHIRYICREVLRYDGSYMFNTAAPNTQHYIECVKEFEDWMGKLLKWGKKHTTLLRFINIQIMTEGMHRGGQDDIDAHARRFENRVIRSSTRLATFDSGEKSDFYKDKILTDGEACKILGLELPEEFEYEGENWIKSPNGYIKAKYEGNKDVMRGLYMLSIPSNFETQINLCEWAHVFHLRNINSGANPEVKEWAESIMSQLHETYYYDFTRDYILEIEN
jgi:hypothetical protein